MDRAALDAAIEFNYPIGGWCPKNRLAEDGEIPHSYPLMETPSQDYLQRTEWNVRDSQGTLIIAYANLSGGTAATKEFAIQYKRPVLIVNLNEEPHIQEMKDWLEANKIKILNIAGPRESTPPGIYQQAKVILELLFQSMQV